MCWNIYQHYTTTSWGTEQAFTVTDGAGNTLWAVSGQASNATSDTTICLADDCYTIDMTDSYGDGWSLAPSIDVSAGGVSILTELLLVHLVRLQVN